MKVETYEGIVEDGRVRLPDDIHLPENSIVFVVVPNQDPASFHVRSPRLANRDQINDFRKKVFQEGDDVGI